MKKIILSMVCILLLGHSAWASTINDPIYDLPILYFKINWLF